MGIFPVFGTLASFLNGSDFCVVQTLANARKRLKSAKSAPWTAAPATTGRRSMGFNFV
jgi:hypothetical protein